MKRLMLSDLLTDPNPTEAAEYSLTILSQPWQLVNGDHILGEMVLLYDRKASFALICRALDELEKTDKSLLYVGTREKCEKWAEVFRKMDLGVEVEKI